MSRLFKLLSVLAVFSFLFIAVGNVYAEGCAEQFKKFDTDNDGVLSTGEYQAAYDSGIFKGVGPSPTGADSKMQFQRLDADNNGTLTVNEFCKDKS